MKILMAASECTPFIKTGGLADVVGTLPLALARGGDDVRVILPYYRDIPQYWKEQTSPICQFYVNLGWRRQYCGIHTLEREGVKYYFIDNEFYFARDNVYGTGQEEGERFGFFCRAVLEAIAHLGFKPDVLHCHDWQAGMIPTLLCTQYQHNDFYRGIKTAFTVHNLRYQGIFTWLYIEDMLGIDEQYFRPDMLEYYGLVSFMKAGIVFSDVVTTVSPTYSQEIQSAYYGERLDGLMRARSNNLFGILNGIEPAEYNPEDDMWLPAHFSVSDLSGKASCKADLQRELGLNEVPDVPIICIISRLCDQKGLDLVECVLDDIMRMDLQLVVLGKGDEHYQDLFSWAAWRYQGRLATRIELNNPLSHRLFAASDMVLIPSQFEPCGLTQMIAMRYGTIPIVRETGGLKDSVTPFNKFTGEGNGFSFANYNAHEMLFTIERAVGYYCDTETWQALMLRAMNTDFSWDVSAKSYKQLYCDITGLVEVPVLPIPEEDSATERKPGAKKGEGSKPQAAPKAEPKVEHKAEQTAAPKVEPTPEPKKATVAAQEVAEEIQSIPEQLEEVAQKLATAGKKVAEDVKQKAQALQEASQPIADDLSERAQKAAKKSGEAAKQTAAKAAANIINTASRTKKAMEAGAKDVQQAAADVEKKVTEAVKKTAVRSKKAVDDATPKHESVKKTGRGKKQ